MNMKVFEQVYNAPSVLNGLCLISNTFNGILAEYTLKDIQLKGE